MPARKAGQSRARQSTAAVREARGVVRDALGAQLEQKATDDFCVAFATRPLAHVLPERMFTVGLARAEALGPPMVPGGVAAINSVVEFAPPKSPPGRLPKRVSARVAEAVKRGLEGVVEEVGEPDKALALLLRQAAVKAARDDFYRSIGPIRDHIERSTSAVPSPEQGSHRVGIAAADVQACWLNRTVRSGADARVLADVASDPQVRKVDLPRPLKADDIPLDVMFRQLRELQARPSFFTGSGVTVGVIDSEVALRHPAFQDRVIHRRNYTQEPFGTPADHGTAVAGFIGASSPEFSGIAPEVTIYNYKVLATSSALDATDFEGALAIQHALEDGVRVVNCSWGAGPAGDGTSREARACDTAWRLGMTIVKSAGNRGPGASSLTTPADAEGVIAVGATNAQGTAIPDYSSRGPAGRRKRPHLVAPGGTLDEGLWSTAPHGGVDDVGAGTSYAAPHVTGAVALLLQREPNLTPDQIRDLLVAACSRVGRATVDTQGAGLLSLPDLFA